MEKETIREANSEGKNSNIQSTCTKDLVGKQYGRLTVVSLARAGKHPMWNCRCQCGMEKSIYQGNLLSGRTTSCGCKKKEVLKETYTEHLHIYKGIQVEKAIAKTTQRNNTSGFRGVIYDKKSGRYRVRMILQGVRYELGWYSDFNEAVNARLRAEEKRDLIVEEYLQLSNQE